MFNSTVSWLHITDTPCGYLWFNTNCIVLPVLQYFWQYKNYVTNFKSTLQTTPIIYQQGERKLNILLKENGLSNYTGHMTECTSTCLHTHTHTINMWFIILATLDKIKQMGKIYNLIGWNGNHSWLKYFWFTLDSLKCSNIYVCTIAKKYIFY